MNKNHTKFNCKFCNQELDTGNNSTSILNTIIVECHQCMNNHSDKIYSILYRFKANDDGIPHFKYLDIYLTPKLFLRYFSQSPYDNPDFSTDYIKLFEENVRRLGQYDINSKWIPIANIPPTLISKSIPKLSRKSMLLSPLYDFISFLEVFSHFSHFL